MAYVDYTYYSNTYKGTAISSDRFDYYEMQAEALIRELTLEASDEHSEDKEVMMATCAAAEQLYNVLEPSDTAADAANIASEKVGEYSVTYRSVAASDRIAEAKKAAVVSARTWLAPTGLLYRGI